MAPMARLAAAFKRLGQEAARPEYRGCPFVNAVAEFNDADHPAAARAIAYEADRRAWLERVLREAGIREAAKLSRQLVALWYGAIVRALITRKPSVIGEAAKAALVLVGAAGARGVP